MIRLSEPFVASIAHSLNLAQIPCVLWGHYLLVLHGIPSGVGSIDFIVPDDLLADGLKILSQLKGLAPCPGGKHCPSRSADRYTPPPAVHVHVEASEVRVGLYPQADVLWFLPPLDGSLVCPKKSQLSRYFVLASDDNVLPPWRPGRGSGVFKEGGDKVVALKCHVMLEALMRTYARDEGASVGGFGASTIVYVEKFVDNDGFLDLKSMKHLNCTTCAAQRVASSV
ncbi:uncharacterized protein DNG_07193 [Cephalotrichum gorgonifer]|uniref:Uncharacterized protein n=1 Tax=Cephalotrichum gorgonifer TaxID=2041049 RepID=A0AAE8N3T4_9PEZI|nr:uncharacterized protein DNG_07193 [Cephalotrichum gorgonifer]